MRSLPPVVHLAVILLAAISVSGALAVAESGSDFRLFYASTQLWAAGMDPYSTADRPNLNHPLLLLPVLPFAWLPLDVATTAWAVAGVAAVLLTFAVVGRATGRPAIELAAMTLAVQGSFIALAMGQVTFVLMPLLTAAWMWDRRGDSARAGAALGLLTTLKPFYGVFGIYLFWRRDWRALIAYAGSSAIGFLAGLALVGWPAYQTWLTGLGSVSWTRHLFNASAWGLAARLFDAAPAIDYSVAWTPVMVSSGLKAGTVVVGLAVAALWTARLASRDIDTAYAALTLGVLLLSPLGWIYYLAVGAAPILAALTRRRVAGHWWWVVPVLCFPEPIVNGRQAGPWATAIIGMWPPAMVISLMFLLELERDDHVQESTSGRPSGS
jgi:hypothetical protein